MFGIIKRKRILDVLRFQYLTVELNHLKWRDFIGQDNPVAGALVSKMGYTEDEKVEVKKEFLRMLVRLELDPARNHLLTTFFETYLKLSEDEEYSLQSKVNQLDPHEEVKVVELMTSYERRGMEKGKIEGKIEGKQDSICTYLEARFPSSPGSLQSKIQSISDLSMLDEVLKGVFSAESLEDVRKVIERATN